MTDAEGVQQELQDYLQQKGINTLFINIVESLLLSKPDNPIQHIIEYLKNNFPEQCKDIVNEVKTVIQATPKLEDTDSEEEEDDEDDLGDMPEVPQRQFPKGRRTSVSAESLDSKKAKTFEAVKYEKSDEDKQRISEIIKENILFKNLDSKQKMVILDALYPKEYKEGDVIITQGDDGDNFYVLDSGVCEVYKDDKLVQTCTESMSFGELALMYNAPRAATVKAKEPSKVWALDRNTFKSILMETSMSQRSLHTGFIEKISLLESLNEKERLKVVDALKVVEFQDGEVIIQQGEAGDHFYIIEDGTAQCTKILNPTDPPTEIATLSSGSYFGEIALLTTRPRQATVTATGPVKCLSLDRKTFMRVMGPLEDILKRNMEKYNLVMANNI